MDSTHVKQAVSYLTEFFEDTALLYAEIARGLLEQKEMIAHPRAGNQGSWRVSSHYQNPKRWIMKDLHRFFIHQSLATQDKAQISEMLNCMLSLYEEGCFPQPMLLCSHIKLSQPLTPLQVYDDAAKTDYLRGMDSTKSCWRADGEMRCGGKLAHLVHRKEDVRTKCIAYAEVFAVDVTSISGREQVQSMVVQPLAALMDGNAPILDHAAHFPQNLLRSWQRS